MQGGTTTLHYYTTIVHYTTTLLHYTTTGGGYLVPQPGGTWYHSPGGDGGGVGFALLGSGARKFY